MSLEYDNDLYHHNLGYNEINYEPYQGYDPLPEFKRKSENPEMKLITRTIPVFQFSELTKESQDKAIECEINFYLECVDYDSMSDNMKRAVNKANSMLTPWFAGSYIWDYCQDEILNGLNECEFLENGDLFTQEKSDNEVMQ